MVLRACIVCGTLSDHPRCPAHRGRTRNGSTRSWREVRARVLVRDNYTCHYCGAHPVNVVDHFTPISHGGTDDEDNLVSCCASCNGSKGELTGAQFGGVDPARFGSRTEIAGGVGANPLAVIPLEHRPLHAKNSPALGGGS